MKLMQAGSCGLLAMLLSSRLVWIHYYILALPAIAVALSRPSTAWAAAIALLLFTRVAAPAGTLFAAWAMNAATLLLFGVMIFHLAQPAPREETSPFPDTRPSS